MLTCNSPTVGVNRYEFKRGAVSLGAAAAANTYTITAAAIGTDDGSYICVASVEGLPMSAGESGAKDVSCELYLCTHFFIY